MPSIKTCLISLLSIQLFITQSQAHQPSRDVYARDAAPDMVGSNAFLSARDLYDRDLCDRDLYRRDLSNRSPDPHAYAYARLSARLTEEEKRRNNAACQKRKYDEDIEESRAKSLAATRKSRADKKEAIEAAKTLQYMSAQ